MEIYIPLFIPTLHSKQWHNVHLILIAIINQFPFDIHCNYKTPFKLLQQFICVSYQFNHGYTMHEYRVYNSIINNVHSFLYIPAICNLHTHIMCASIIQPPVSHVFFKPPEMFLKSPEFGWLPNLCIPV